MEEFNNMKKKWSPKRPKTGKHAKKVVAIVAGIAVVGLLRRTVPIRSRSRSRQFCQPLVCRKQ